MNIFNMAMSPQPGMACVLKDGTVVSVEEIVGDFVMYRSITPGVEPITDIVSIHDWSNALLYGRAPDRGMIN